MMSRTGQDYRWRNGPTSRRAGNDGEESYPNCKLHELDEWMRAMVMQARVLQLFCFVNFSQILIHFVFY